MNILVLLGTNRQDEIKAQVRAMGLALGSQADCALPYRP